jgi:guanylate kinase
MMDAEPRVFVISGPSGAGKGTLTVELLKRVPSLTHSISATTRKPRPGEINGVDYHFVTDKEFDNYIADGDFLEWAYVHSNRYGTLKSAVRDQLRKGRGVVLEIDVQGGSSVKEQMPEAVLIFIEPPSMEELAKRLKGRNTETDEELEQRLKNAIREMEFAGKYDYIVINDDMNKAIDELVNIVIEMQGKT